MAIRQVSRPNHALRGRPWLGSHIAAIPYLNLKTALNRLAALVEHGKDIRDRELFSAPAEPTLPKVNPRSKAERFLQHSGRWPKKF